jgi:uncharacterized repeat protein (TIGR03806 family)
MRCFHVAWSTALLAALVSCAAHAQTYGLDARPSNTSCIAPARPTTAGTATYTDAFPTAPAFTEPVKLLQPPGDATRWFVLEKAGRIRTFTTANPSVVTTWLDLTARVDDTGDGGLLGMAFHPQWPTTREIYLYYTAPGSGGNPLTTVVSRFIIDNTTQPVSPVEQQLITVAQPYTNHKGGDIAFGTDNSLYISLGDGGDGGDPENHGQDTTDLLGSILRIDVLGVPFSERYRIPADNPSSAGARCGPGANAAACPEIYAWGLRNPWRWSFDRQTGAMWVADVGQDSREEIDLIERGGNYGWRCREGILPFNTAGCPASGFVNPVYDYDHAVGASITGGFVYRGNAISALRGRYVFADFVSGWVAALQDNGSGGYAREELFDDDQQVSGFGQGVDGEVYYFDYATGRALKIVPSSISGSDLVPVNLASTGCVNSSTPQLPASGLVPYDVNAPLWSDSATKTRWMALPNNTRITIDAQGDWSFPSGTILIKNFRLSTGRIVETRLLMRHTDGVWRGYTYEWNDAQTGATRVYGGKTRVVDGQTWTYPSEGQCMQCHTSAAGFSLGPETAQLNRDFLYTSTGRTANELATLDHIGMFSAPLPGQPSALPRLPDPADASKPIGLRARAWLHSNCANCHRPGGLTPVNIDLRNVTALQSTQSCNVSPTSGTLGLVNARRIAPGVAASSVLASRIGRRDAWGMPPLGSSVVDATGVGVVTSWINGLGSCTDSDTDGVDDTRDNCTQVANADQRDTDGDGYGNVCDADLDNSGLTTSTDFNMMRVLLNTTNPNADLNGSGHVTAQDFAMLRSRLNTAPGPSGLH